MVLSAILSYRSVKSWLRVEGRRPVSNLLGYRYEANGPVWGFLPAGLKEVAQRGVGFQARWWSSFVEVSVIGALTPGGSRTEKNQREKAVALRRAPTPHYLKMAFGEFVVARWPVTFI